MSYKSFKEYFQSCPVQRCSSASKGELILCQHRPSSSALAATYEEERKPPKTSLKDKIAALVASGSDRYRNKERPSQSRTSTSPPIPPESEKYTDLEEGNGSGTKRSFFESSETGLHPNWTEEDGGRLDESRIETSGVASSSYRPPNKRRRNGLSLLSTHDFQRKNSPPNFTRSVDEVEEHSPTSESGDDEELGLESEAGLSTPPPPEGPFEPLQLWPPPGEGTSDGVDEVVQVPASINSRLLEHQRPGVVFLYNQYRKDIGGILGDDM